MARYYGNQLKPSYFSSNGVTRCKQLHLFGNYTPIWALQPVPQGLWQCGCTLLLPQSLQPLHSSTPGALDTLPSTTDLGQETDRQVLQSKLAWLLLQSCLQTHIFISDLSSYLTELLQIHAWCTHCLGTCNGQCASTAQGFNEQPTRAALWQLQCYARTQITCLHPVYLPLGQQISWGCFYYFVFF